MKSMTEAELAHYVGQWVNILQYGSVDAQEAAVYALRSHGHTVWGEGYDDEFRWLWHPPGKNIDCVIEPRNRGLES